VDKDIQLEVLDWGGAGRAIVLLSGLGGTAHLFDDFALKLTGANHVYGITRRGFGASTVAASGYDADRLGDDVLAVLDSFHLVRPVLVGVSFGGEELSSIGSRHLERVAGLVYLDAAYQYAFDNGNGSTLAEQQGFAAPQPPPPNAGDLANFAAFQAWMKATSGVSVPEAEFRQTMNSRPDGSVGDSRILPYVPEAALAGMKKYTELRLPVLAIFAAPHNLGPWINNSADASIRAAAEAVSARETAWVEKQANAFERGVPGARVVRIPNANHIVFLSNETDVLREVRAFLGTLH
jgi:pimeloyl-ACP methyl ester carboxylesterase